MKIGIVHFNLAAESGDPRVVFSLARALTRLGHSVIIYTAEFDRKFFPELHEGLVIKRISPRVPLSSVMGGAGLWKKLSERIRQEFVFFSLAKEMSRKIDPDLDILDLHNDASFRIGRYYKKTNPRARIVWTMYNSPFYRTKKSGFLFNVLSILRAFYGRLSVWISISGIHSIVVLDEERRAMALPFRKPVRILRIPVDFESFFRPVKTISLGERRVTLMGVGSLSPFRRFEDIILAGHYLRDRGFDARVILVCRDFWNESGYRSMLINIAQRTGMTKFVDFRFAGATEAELREVQKQSDVFVFPNVVNIWGMAAFEAMAAGLPLVVSRVTSVAEVLKDGINAFMTEPGDHLSVGEKIEDLISDPALYKKVALGGQSFVRGYLNWDRYAGSFIEAASGRNQEVFP